MATIKHIFTSPKADGTDTSLVRPSDWNSAHQFTLLEAASLSGNTSGALALISSGTFYLAGGNNITLSQNANSVTISAGASGGGGSINFSASTTSFNLDSVVFSNSNGVSFGINGSTITATVKTDYLTTAMGSNAGTDFVQATATIAGTNISGTVASNVLSLSLDNTWDRAELDALPFEYIFAGSNITISDSPGADAISIFAPDTTQFLTTAMASDAGSRFVNTSAGLNLTSISATFNSNSISLSVGPYITTAMASNRGTDFVQATAAFAGTSASGTINSTGISVSVGPYITTAMASNRGTDFVQATAAFAGTNASGTINSTGISVSVQAPSGATLNVSAGTTSGNLTQVVFADSNLMSFGLNGSTVTGDFRWDDRGELEAQPWEYIFPGTNMSLSESPDGGAITLYAGTDISVNVSAGTTSSNVSRFVLSDSNLISFGLSNTVITADFRWDDRMELDAQPWEYVFAGSNITISESPDGGAITLVGPTPGGGGSINFSAGTTSGNLDSVVFSNASGVSFGLNGSTITATVQTNYLTTAMVSDAGSRFVNTSAGLNLTSISATFASNSISLSVGPYLTTAMASNRGSDFVQATAGFNGTGAVGTIASNSISISVSDQTSGMSELSLADAQLAALPADYILAGANISLLESPTGDALVISASDPRISYAGGGTGVYGSSVLFSDANGVSWTVTSTTADQAIISASVQTNYSTLTTAMTDLYLDRVEVDAQPWEYIYAGSNITISESPDGGAITLVGPSPSGASVNFSAGTTSNDLTQLVVADSNGISFGLNAGTLTATVQTNYLTTAMASDAGSRFVNTSAGLNLTSISATFNSNSITLSVGPYITTAMASNAGSNFVNTSAGLNLTNISATFNSNSISLSVAAGGAGSVNFSAGTTSQNLATVVFSDSNSIVFGLNGSTLTASFLLDDRAELDAQPWEYIHAGSNLFISESPTADAITIDALDTWDRAELEAQPWEYIFAGSNITITDSPGGDGISISGSGGVAAGVSTMGNTAGNTGTSSSGTIYFQGSNSLTISVSTGAGAQTIIFQPLQSALSGGNGISLSTNGSTIIIMTV